MMLNIYRAHPSFVADFGRIITNYEARSADPNARSADARRAVRTQGALC